MSTWHGCRRTRTMPPTFGTAMIARVRWRRGDDRQSVFDPIAGATGHLVMTGATDDNVLATSAGTTLAPRAAPESVPLPALPIMTLLAVLPAPLMLAVPINVRFWVMLRPYPG